MAGRILTPFCILVPFWLICAFVGWAAMMEIWPAILVAGVSFAIPQFFISNFHGPWLANIGASVISMVCLVAFLFIWHPKRIWTFEGEEAKTESRAYSRLTAARKSLAPGCPGSSSASSSSCGARRPART